MNDNFLKTRKSGKEKMTTGLEVTEIDWGLSCRYQVDYTSDVPSVPKLGS